MSDDEKWTCPLCKSIGDDWCWHTPNQWELARAFAVHMQQPEPSDEQIGYFLYDAESVEEYVGAGPWTLADLEVRTPRRGDAPKSNAWLLTSLTGRHVIAVDGEQERMANQEVVPAEYVCTLGGAE